MSDKLYIAVHRWKEVVDPSCEAVLKYLAHCPPGSVLQPRQNSDLFMAKSNTAESSYDDLLIVLPDQPNAIPNSFNIIFLHDTEPGEAELPKVLEEQKVILAMWNEVVTFGQLLRTGTSEIGGTVYTTMCKNVSALDDIVFGKTESLGQIIKFPGSETIQ